MPVQSDNLPQVLEIAEWNKGGINQSTRRSTIDDADLWWIENYFPLARGELRSAWGPSAPIYTAPAGTAILRLFTANISGPALGFAFLNNGHVQQFLLDAPHTVTDLGQIWTPIAPHWWADLKLWRPTFVGATPGESGGLLIGSPQGLYAWDGTTLTSPGQAPPLWLTDGATTDASGAALVMPVGLPGIYALEVYNQRLWVMGQTVISFSAPSNGADFSTAGGGGSFGYFGDQLTVSYTAMYATAGFLYLFGDSCINWVNNIQLVGQVAATTTPNVANPFTTQFQLSNYNPQIGQRFFRPVGEWLQAITVLDKAGGFLATGDGQATWISEKITNVWDTVAAIAPDGTPFEPTMSPVHVFGQRWLLFSGVFTDPWGISRSMILCWNGNIWTVATQRYEITYVVPYEQNSCIDCYGTDGTVVVKLFAQPDAALQKIIATKAYNGQPAAPLDIKNWSRVYVHLQDLAGTPEGTFLVGELTTGGGGIPNGSEQVSFGVQPGQDDTRPHPVSGQGITAALDLRGYSPDYVIERIMLAYEARTRFGA